MPTRAASVDEVASFVKCVVTASGAEKGTLPDKTDSLEIKAKHLGEYDCVPVELDSEAHRETHDLASIWALMNKYLHHTVANPSTLRTIISNNIQDGFRKSLYLRCPSGSGTIHACSTPTSSGPSTTSTCSCTQIDIKIKNSARTLTSPLFGARFQNNDSKVISTFGTIPAEVIKGVLTANDLCADLKAVREKWQRCKRTPIIKKRAATNSSSSSTTTTTTTSNKRRFKPLDPNVIANAQVVSPEMTQQAAKAVTENPAWGLAQVDLANGMLDNVSEQKLLENTAEGNAMFAQIVTAQLYVDAFSVTSPARRKALTERVGQTSIKLRFEGSSSATAIVVESSTVAATAATTTATVSPEGNEKAKAEEAMAVGAPTTTTTTPLHLEYKNPAAQQTGQK